MEFLDGERPATIVFLTDGLATVGIESAEGILELVERNAPERTQLFAFGVGYDVDTVLLDALATEFTGSSHYVTPEQRIDTEVARLWEMVSTPSWPISRSSSTASTPSTWLRPASPASSPAARRCSRAATTAPARPPSHHRQLRDGPETFAYDVLFPERDTDDPAISQLWAQRRVPTS